MFEPDIIERSDDDILFGYGDTRVDTLAISDEDGDPLGAAVFVGFMCPKCDEIHEFCAIADSY